VFHGWRVVAACFVIAAVAWALGTFGASVYLQAVTAAHGWPIADVAFAITLFYLVSALVQRAVGRGIDRWGPRPVLCLGAVSMTLGVAAIGQVTARWQLYPCFILIGIGWAALSTTGIAATVAPWFERHQGRSMTLAIMGASVGAILGVPVLLLAIRELGLAQGLAVVSAVAAAVLLPLIGRVLRFRRPEELGLQRDGHASAAAAAPAPATRPIATRANRPVLLWSAAVAFALGLAMQIGFITHHVTLAEPLLGTVGAGLLVSATGGSALVGRLILARIVDGVAVRGLACLVMIAQTGALLALALWPTVPVLVGASLVYGYGIGHITTLGPIVVRREFGAAAFGATYGTAASVIQLTSAFGPAAIGVLRDSFGGYRPGLAVASAVTLIACTILFAGGRLAARLPSPGPSATNLS
jgi:predicted MFS family arabinose efflux permease